MRKTETTQFPVNYHSSFIRFSGSAHIACDVFKGIGVLPQHAQLYYSCPACEFCFADKPVIENGFM